MESILLGLAIGTLLALGVAYLDRGRQPRWVRRFLVFATTFDGTWLVLYAVQHRQL